MLARRLVSLLRHLPLEGAVARAEGAWGDEVELQAVIVEEIDALMRLTYSAHSGKRAPWAPLEVPRPGAAAGQPRARREATPDELAAMFGGGE